MVKRYYLINDDNITQFGGDIFSPKSGTSVMLNDKNINKDQNNYKWNIKFSSKQEYQWNDIYPVDLYVYLIQRYQKIEKSFDTHEKFIDTQYNVRKDQIIRPYIAKSAIMKSGTPYQKTEYDERKVPINYWMGKKVVSILQYEFLNDTTVPALEIIYTFNIKISKKKKYLSLSSNIYGVEPICYLLTKKYIDLEITNVNSVLLKYQYDNFNMDVVDGLLNLYHIKPYLATELFSNNNIKKIVEEFKDTTYDYIFIDPHLHTQDMKFHRDQLNHQNFISLILISLLKLQVGGTLICIIPGITTKITFELVYILQSMFNKTYIYNQQSATPLWATSSLVLLDYKGIDNKIIDNLYTINEKMLKIDPTGGKNMSIENKDEAKLFDITPKSNYSEYINQIIDIDTNTNTDKLKHNIKNFNTIKLSIFSELLDDIEIYDNTTKDDFRRRNIFEAVKLAKILNLDIKPNFDKTAFSDEFGKKLIRDMYSLEDQILFKLKKHNNLPLKLDIFKNQKRPKWLKKYLIDFEQTGRIIDTRSLAQYDKMKKFIRYYENSLGYLLKDKFNIQLNNRIVSRAWIKMYEIIEKSKIIKQYVNNTTLKTFHICEAPGNMIMAIEHYLKTKTKIKNFEWTAQSLVDADIWDDYGLIKKYNSRWDFGEDKTGDIISMKNIKYYQKKYTDIDIITGDCGLSREAGAKNDLASKLLYAQLVAMLHILKKGGNFVIKAYQQGHNPSYFGILYMIYTKFEKVMIYKPLQNPFSGEYYLIGINYQDKISDEESELLFNFLNNFDKYSSIYRISNIPENFMSQFEKITSKLSQLFRNTIYRNIYYVDNYDKMSDDMKKDVVDAIKMKNIEWVDEFKIK